MPEAAAVAKGRAEVTRMARDASPAVMQLLIDMATLKLPVKVNVAIKAAEIVLNRAWGRPKQQVDIRAQTQAFVAMLPAPIADAAAWASAAAQLATPSPPKCVNEVPDGTRNATQLPSPILDLPHQAHAEPAGEAD